MNSKKKELIGSFFRPGLHWTEGILRVFDHDFPSFAQGVVIPHGLYDLKADVGHLHLLPSHDTGESACDHLESWWTEYGRPDEPGPPRTSPRWPTAGRTGRAAGRTRSPRQGGHPGGRRGLPGDLEPQIPGRCPVRVGRSRPIGTRRTGNRPTVRLAPGGGPFILGGRSASPLRSAGRRPMRFPRITVRRPMILTAILPPTLPDRAGPRGPTPGVAGAEMPGRGRAAPTTAPPGRVDVQSSAAIAASLATVLRLRAVPAVAAGIFSFDSAIPAP